MKAIIGMVALLLLVACASQEMPETTDENRVMEGATAEEPAAPVETSAEMDVAAALQSGGSAKCVVEKDGTTVTMYMKNMMARSDMMPMDAHGIYTDDTIYTWTGNQGFMMKKADIEKLAAQAQEGQKQYQSSEDVAKDYPDMKCSAFNVPDSMFTPPPGIEFQDMAEMMKQMQAQMPEGMPDISQYQ